MKEKEIGEIITLVRTRIDEKGYKDQFGYFHPASVIIEKINVKIRKIIYQKGTFCAFYPSYIEAVPLNKKRPLKRDLFKKYNSGIIFDHKWKKGSGEEFLSLEDAKLLGRITSFPLVENGKIIE